MQVIEKGRKKYWRMLSFGHFAKERRVSSFFSYSIGVCAFFLFPLFSQVNLTRCYLSLCCIYDRIDKTIKNGCMPNRTRYNLLRRQKKTKSNEPTTTTVTIWKRWEKKCTKWCSLWYGVKFKSEYRKFVTENGSEWSERVGDSANKRLSKAK